MQFNFIGETYQSQSSNVDAQETTNLYPESVESGTGKNKLVLYPRPGLTLFCTLPTAPVRGLWAGDERLFAAAGSKLYEVSNGGVATELGEIGNDTGDSPVQIFPNGNQIFIVSAGKAYCDNGSGPVLAPVPAAPNADPLTPAGQEDTAATGCFLDSYFVAAKPDSKVFFTSNALDGTTWGALEFETKEGYPDNIAAILASQQELWLVGDQTTEVWRQEGDIDHIWRKDPGAFIHQGTVAPYSVSRHANGVAWLGGDTEGRAVAWRAQGFQPVRFSTHAVEQAWSQYSTLSDAIAWSFTIRGHFFWLITFPTANATWVYDATTKLWHKWTSGTGDRFRGRCHAFTFGKHFVGDHTSGAIYELSHSAYTDAGTAIERIRSAPHISNEQANIFYHRFQLDMEVGAGSNPQLTLEWSDDGGHTWSTPKTVTAGAVGEYAKRVIWRRLGKSRDRVFRVKTSHASKIVFINAYLDATPGTA